MEQLRVEVESGSYNIYLGAEVWALVESFGQNYTEIIVVTDATVDSLYGERLPFPKYRLPIGEAQKTPANALKLVGELADRGLDRQSLLVALGGGVVGDLVGFAASIYLRGIAYVHIPTTLLAQVDSSVGGKTGVNLPQGKNLVGTFYQPRGVFIDPEVLETLPPRELSNGLAEMLKYGIIHDPGLFQVVREGLQDFYRCDPQLLTPIIKRCCEIKAHIVAQDELEQGTRKLLNYGHTFGHALEMLTGYEMYSHGEAVLLGMLLETRLAKALGLLDRTNFTEIVEGLGKAKELANLNVPPPSFSQEQLISALLHDKKNRQGRISFMLPRKIGELEEVLLTPEELQALLERVLEP